MKTLILVGLVAVAVGFFMRRTVVNIIGFKQVYSAGQTLGAKL